MLLAREFSGTMHCVMVAQEGVAWQGSIYSSLSETARPSGMQT